MVIFTTVAIIIIINILQRSRYKINERAKKTGKVYLEFLIEGIKRVNELNV